MTKERPLTRGLLAAVTVLALVLVGPPATAAPGPPGEDRQARETARTFGQRGVERFEAGDYAAAIEMFKQAEENFHAPTHWLFIARAESKLGKLLSAERSYKRVLEDELGKDAPKAFTSAQEAARDELSSLKARIPEISVDIRGVPEGATAEVFLDGDRLEAGPRGSRAHVDPGTHHLRVTAPTVAPFEREVEVTEGKNQQVLVELQSTRTSLGKVPGAVVLGLGAVGLGIGTVTGAMSLSRVSELDRLCPDRQCSPAEQPIGDDARTLGTVSTVGFVVGGVLAAAGVTLLVIQPFDQPPTSTTSTTSTTSPPRRRGTPLSVAAGPGSILVRGSF
ncbi:PEGA domain-containing protein [Chondromyces apiculatus]|uniref:PEGA domain-containing protein n=1 Tax=Chondromyces apiculatus DSM 436 TaxID=1192034 RepID=A0A017TJD9_9BACT|nr:PEGA domain-containing protein [Chondromyces apiculatus]EYF08746.1 Hypothetical protein CAP_2607 [Chondromyces apiculatus DSM 436]